MTTITDASVPATELYHKLNTVMETYAPEDQATAVVCAAVGLCGLFDDSAGMARMFVGNFQGAMDQMVNAEKLNKQQAETRVDWPKMQQMWDVTLAKTSQLYAEAHESAKKVCAAMGTGRGDVHVRALAFALAYLAVNLQVNDMDELLQKFSYVAKCRYELVRDCISSESGGLARAAAGIEAQEAGN